MSSDSSNSSNTPNSNTSMPSSVKWQHKQKHGKPVGKRELLDKTCATDNHDEHERLQDYSWSHYKQFHRAGRGFSAYMDKRRFWHKRATAGDIVQNAVADATENDA